MVERNVGQMSLADGLVQAPRSSILDEVEAVWVPLRSLLGKRGGSSAGNGSYPAEALLRCLLAGSGAICLIRLWKPRLRIDCRSGVLLA
ncbi:hypothetical protein [Bradyrhizobium sp. NBAIM01]|uniref:hypothetical protein n=1 Tax=Bradyrhizobium sp. NBAIM01 TaxID=2793818 RepID=UPI00201C034E|nr:hypothetical protein [Bradyrhizobium sp. NBAIM01]